MLRLAFFLVLVYPAVLAVGQDAVGPLIARLKDANAEVRQKAATALGRSHQQPEKSIPALHQLLRDPDEHVRYSAQWSLSQIAAGLQSPPPIANRETLRQLLANAAKTLAETHAPEAFQLRIRQAIESLPGAVANAQPTVDLATLIEELDSSDDFLQVRALARLKHVDRSALPQLFQTLASTFNESSLEWKLPQALAEIGEPIIPTLIAALDSEDESVRDLALEVFPLVSSHAHVALPQLNKLLVDVNTSEECREKILTTLTGLGPAAKASTPLLVKLVANAKQPDSIRSQAVLALGAIGPEATAALPALTKVLRSDQPDDERIEAASAIAKIAATKETADLLTQLIAATDDSEFAAGLAAKLGTLGANAAAAVPLLIRLIENPEVEPLRRQEIVQALADIGIAASPAIPVLIRILADPDERSCVHVACATTLGKLGPAAVGALAQQLQNPQVETRLTIARALLAIGNQAAPATGDLLHTLENDDEVEVRILAAIALGKIGQPASTAVPLLTKLLQDQDNDEQLRAICADSIGCIDPTAGPLLNSFLADPDKQVQAAAAYSLHKNRREPIAAALPHLLKLLADEEMAELVRMALTDIGKDAIPPLSAAALDPKNELEFRTACLAVLSNIGLEAAPPLLAALNDEDLAEAAEDGLQRLGERVVPILLAAVDDEARYSQAARESMQAVVRFFQDGFGAGDGELEWGQPHPLARIAEAKSGTATAPPRRVIRLDGPLAVMGKRSDTLPAESLRGHKTVKVFYGTNRQPLAATAATTLQIVWLPTLALAALAICLVCLLWQTPKNILAILASSFGLVALAGFHMPQLRIALSPPEASARLVYGAERSDQVEVGVCDVTIPNIHEVGELEEPSLLKLEIRVDPDKHIVLRGIQPLARDAFFTDLQGELDHRGKNLLVFVHGYNVSFEDAARRTAQMAVDLEFPGAAAFFSWPSQANWYKYRADEKNVELSVDPLKSFLLDLAERSGATTINLVAHSMGNRALTSALREIDASASDQGMRFNQVVLAAPDIDATIFKQRIAPAIVAKARRITLYASSKDLALYASRQFNSGDARAGDAGEDLVVVPGIETIDASAGDCSLLGHCYYGESATVLHDIARLLQDQPAQARPNLRPIPHDGLTYWLFDPDEIANRSRFIIERR